VNTQNIVLSIIVSSGLILLIIELVRRRKLNEEYSWLWMITGAVLLVLSIFPGLLLFITRAIGAVAPANTLFFFGVIFLLLIVLHYSIVISKLTNNIRALAQKMALLELEQSKSKKE